MRDFVLCRPFVQTWAQQHLPASVTEGSRAYLVALFEEHVDAGLAWVRSEGSEYLPSVDIALVTSLANLVQVIHHHTVRSARLPATL